MKVTIDLAQMVFWVIALILAIMDIVPWWAILLLAGYSIQFRVVLKSR